MPYLRPVITALTAAAALTACSSPEPPAVPTDAPTIQATIDGLPDDKYQQAVAEWDGIVAGIVQGIRAGRPGAALLAAIRECGQILERHGVARRPDDVDELPNELRRERPE